jgi:mycothiol system anti-sigma-R factor
MSCDEALDLITALVDGEIVPEERRTLEKHLEGCKKCELIYGEQSTLKHQLRTAAGYLRAPPRLRQRILTDARVASAEVEKPGLWERVTFLARPLLQPSLVVAVLVLLSLPTFYLTIYRRPEISLEAVATYTRIMRGEMQLISQSDPEQLKAHLTQAVQHRFHPMGYDLSMMDLEPKGGLVRDLAGRPIIAVLYQGKAFSLICYTFLGTEGDAPASASVVFDGEKRLNFYTFTSGGINAVMHVEGNTICILASEMPMDKLTAIARLKARPTIR